MIDDESGAGPGVLLDHLVLGVPDLKREVARIREEWGCVAYPGGRHPQWGTWNAIVPLEGGAYLEVVGPHPEPPPRGPRVFGLDHVTEPTLVTWAVRPDRGCGGAAGLPGLADRMDRGGSNPGRVMPGRRRTPSGVLLTWALTDPFAHRMGGTAPFLIDWGDTPHPSQAGPPVVALESLEAGYPDAGQLGRVLAAIGGDGLCRISPSPRPALKARIRVPAGSVLLHG